MDLVYDKGYKRRNGVGTVLKDYEERLQSIRHKKNAQHNKDYWTRCQCDKIMGYHTALEATACKKLPPSKEARGKIMNDREIDQARLSRD